MKSKAELIPMQDDGQYLQSSGEALGISNMKLDGYHKDSGAKIIPQIEMVEEMVGYENLNSIANEKGKKGRKNLISAIKSVFSIGDKPVAENKNDVVMKAASKMKRSPKPTR